MITPNHYKLPYWPRITITGLVWGNLKIKGIKYRNPLHSPFGKGEEKIRG